VSRLSFSPKKWPEPANFIPGDRTRGEIASPKLDAHDKATGLEHQKSH
jgi:hypothetical protein